MDGYWQVQNVDIFKKNNSYICGYCHFKLKVTILTLMKVPSTF